MAVVDRVRDLAAPLLTAEGLELFDVEFNAGRLIISADGTGGTPTDLDALTRATHTISAALDHDDPIQGHYILEVSSPGLERRLRTPDHFKHRIGATVKVKTTDPSTRRVEGTLDGADDDAITVAGHRIPYADIERAQTVFVWPEPGSTPRSPKTKKKAT